jgi:RimJ/RimL family protein N-acetyltransferase
MRTERLLLRPLEARDALPISRLASDWDVARQTAQIPHPYPLTVADQWIASLGADEFVRAIEFEGELIGACGFVANGPHEAEIGYWLGRPYWGRGFATEAARALVAHCFLNLGHKRLTCCHFTDNPASARVIRKLGFRRTGTCRTWCAARGAETDCVVYARRRPVSALWRQAAE